MGKVYLPTSPHGVTNQKTNINIALKLQVLQKTGNFSTSTATMSSSTRTPLRGISSTFNIPCFPMAGRPRRPNQRRKRLAVVAPGRQPCSTVQGVAGRWCSWSSSTVRLPGACSRLQGDIRDSILCRLHLFTHPLPPASAALRRLHTTHKIQTFVLPPIYVRTWWTRPDTVLLTTLNNDWIHCDYHKQVLLVMWQVRSSGLWRTNVQV
jgi:hypothetical protein